MPELAQQWISLIDNVTPAYQLNHFPNLFNHSRLYIKREDLTSELYGGNKVRNLEFLLGQAKHNKAKNILALSQLLTRTDLKESNFLYWHTFSDAAMKINSNDSLSGRDSYTCIDVITKKISSSY